MKVLKRKYAQMVVRLSMLALLAIGFALGFRKTPLILHIAIVVLVVSVLLIAFIRWRFLRCPNCGKGFNPPFKKKKCARCGREIDYEAREKKF